jgi:hypothetical protein
MIRAAVEVVEDTTLIAIADAPAIPVDIIPKAAVVVVAVTAVSLL